MLSMEGVTPIVCFSAGETNIQKVKSEDLHRRLREALEWIRGQKCAGCRLRRRGVVDEWLFCATVMNWQLPDNCKSNLWSFVDSRGHIFGRNSLYARDGVHLSCQEIALVCLGHANILTLITQ